MSIAELHEQIAAEYLRDRENQARQMLGDVDPARAERGMQLMRRSTWYRLHEFNSSIRLTGWAIIGAVWPALLRRRAASGEKS